MRSERVHSLSCDLMSKPASFANTLSDQWTEYTLDDSAIRRMDIPEMFLFADAILLGLENVTNGLVVYPKKDRRPRTGKIALYDYREYHDAEGRQGGKQTRCS